MATNWTVESASGASTSATISGTTVTIDDGTTFKIANVSGTNLFQVNATTATINGDLAITGGNITSALTCDSTLTITGAATLSSTLGVTGATTLSSTLTVAGASQLNSTLTVGVNGTGYDVTLYGNTSGKYMYWDEGADSLYFRDNTYIRIGDSVNDLLLYHGGSTSHIVTGSGASTLNISTSTSGVAVNIGHATSQTTIGQNLIVTGDLTVTGGDLTLGEVNYLSDSSGTGTLKNIDALDGTTEATIESYLDTLPNVSSIGGNVTIGGDLTISGGNITNAITCDSTLGVTGAVTLSSTINGVTLGVDSDSVLVQSTSASNGTSNTLFGKNAGDSIASGGNYNTLFGEDAGTAITTGDDNVIIGYDAGDELVTGVQNIVVGSSALTNADNNESRNVVIGINALYNMNGDEQYTYNMGIGYSAGYFITTGIKNTHIGNHAGYGATGDKSTGDANTTLGYSAGYLLQGGSEFNTIIGAYAGDAAAEVDKVVLVGYSAGSAINSADADGTVAVGYQAAYSATSAIGSVAVGNKALYSNATGDQNTAVGYDALYYSLDINNTALGMNAGKYVENGTRNTFIGCNAGRSIDGNRLDGDHNIAIGNSAGLELQGGANYNTIVGSLAGNAMTTSAKTTLVGYEAGHDIDDAGSDGTVAMGYQSLKDMNSSAATYNTSIGYQAGTNLTTAAQSTFLGYQAGMGTAITGGSNTAVGYRAGRNLTGAGSGNTIMGSSAGDAITTGLTNVIIGKDAGTTCTTSKYLTLVGTNAGKLIAAGQTDSDGTVAIGYGSLASLTDGQYNTAVGYQPGLATSTGNHNTILGYTALAGNIDGSYNIAIGNYALKAYEAESADQGANVAVGYTAGRYIKTGQRNVAIGQATGYGTATVDDRLTSDDNVWVGYRAGHIQQGEAGPNTYIGSQSGLLDTTGKYNVGVGYQTLSSMTTNPSNASGKPGGNTAVGYQTLEDNNETDQTTEYGHNTAIGMQACRKLESGMSNVAVGYKSMGVGIVTGDYNVCVGVNAGQVITEGTNIIAMGYNSCDANTGGNRNVGLGGYTLTSNILGDNNTAVGHYALYSCVSPDGTGSNTAVGKDAGEFLTTGIDNTFIGALAGQGLTGGDVLTGDNNTCVGKAAGLVLQGDADDNTLIGKGSGIEMTEGNGNVCVGLSSGDAITTGNNNVCIGNATDAGSGALRTIVMGYSAVTSADYNIVIGDSITNSTTETFMFGRSGKTIISSDFDAGTVTWTQSSDERKKRNIKDDTLGLDFINKLSTKTFQWKPQNEYPKEWNDYSEDNIMDTEKVHHGLIAQDVKKALDECEIDTFGMWSEDNDGMQRLGNGLLVLPLVKAVQELTAKINELETKLQEK